MGTIELVDNGDGMAWFRIEFKGHKYIAASTSSPFPQVTLESFTYETEVRDHWWNIQSGDVILDVGAGYGSYTLPALACGASLVVAFEPNRWEHFDLCTNLFINGYHGRCILLNAVVNDGIETVESFYPETHGARTIGTQERRLATSIDAFVTIAGMTRVDWIKIDVEGSELSVVNGMLETMKKFHPKVIIENHIHFIPGIDKEIRKIIAPLGFNEECGRKEDDENGCWSLWTWKEK